MNDEKPTLLPDPRSPEAPKYWMYETGRKLKPAMRRLIERQPLSAADIELIQLYLKQWIDSGAWDMNPHAHDVGTRELRELREQVRAIQTAADIDAWLKRALEFGIDPL